MLIVAGYASHFILVRYIFFFLKHECPAGPSAGEHTQAQETDELHPCHHRHCPVGTRVLAPGPLIT